MAPSGIEDVIRKGILVNLRRVLRRKAGAAPEEIDEEERDFDRRMRQRLAEEQERIYGARG